MAEQVPRRSPDPTSDADASRDVVPTGTPVRAFPHDGYEFGLCLTHDLDRPYKRWQAPFYAFTDRDPHHLRDLVTGHNPWWQFDTIRAIEDSLGVRSAFYVLREPPLFSRPPRDWLSPRYWVEHLGRYDPDTPELADVLRSLDDDGWEIGVHGSLGTHENRPRLHEEVRALESLLGHPVLGGRQHHLQLDPPRSWRHHAAVGLGYDASFGSATTVGFDYGYRPFRPFGDDFVVFPLTAMERPLLADGLDAARATCDRLLEEALEHNAVATVLFHPRNFGDDFPGHADCYRYLVERALDLGAWVGSPGALYERLDHPQWGRESTAARGRSDRPPSPRAGEHW